MHPYQEALLRRLNAIEPGIHDRLEELHMRPPDVGKEVLGVLLSTACKAQNAANIVLGRGAIARVPHDWLLRTAPEVVESTLDLADYWEYGRLLEVLSQSASELMPPYIQLGLASNDEEIRAFANSYR